MYRLLGKKGLESETSPPVGEAIINADVGYYLREDGRSIQRFDWQKFVEFAECHLRLRKALQKWRSRRDLNLQPSVPQKYS